MTLYEVLGIHPDATSEEVKRAYLRKALNWLPERNPANKEEAERQFKAAGYAYSILSDQNRRKEHDNALLSGRRFGDNSEFSDEKAFSVFLATVLDLAFELAQHGADAISIFRTLQTEGCPEAIAHKLAQRAVTMAQRAPLNDARTSTENQTQRPSTNSQQSVTPTPDQAPQSVSPWKRLWARLFDFSLAIPVVFPPWYLVVIDAKITYGLKAIFALLTLNILAFLFIGILGGIFGNTPGKSLLGISVTKDGRAPTLAEYVMRELSVFLRGYWLGIPVILLIPQFLAFRAIRGGKHRTSWDENGGFDVVQIREGKARIFTFTISLIALVFLSNVAIDAVRMRGKTDPLQPSSATGPDSDAKPAQKAPVEKERTDNFLKKARPPTESEILRSQGIGGNQDLGDIKAWADAQLSARSIGWEDRQDAHNLALMWQRQIITKLGHSPERSLFLGYSIILNEFDDSRLLCRPDLKSNGGIVALENGNFSTFPICRQL